MMRITVPGRRNSMTSCVGIWGTPGRRRCAGARTAGGASSRVTRSGSPGRAANMPPKPATAELRGRAPPFDEA
jgi:hypothetical protein